MAKKWQLYYHEPTGSYEKGGISNAVKLSESGKNQYRTS